MILPFDLPRHLHDSRRCLLHDLVCGSVSRLFGVTPYGEELRKRGAHYT